MAKSHLNNGP